MPSPTASATPAEAGLEGQPIVLGSGWAGAHVSDAPPGTTYAYVHYPQGAIQYDEVVVDDLLVDVQYVCYDRVRPLFSWFESVEDGMSVEKRYTSSPLQFVQQGCQVVFTVDNAVGDTIGIRFKAHCPQCIH
ncbi:MAG TPA: hypothetical protein ENL34_08175 [Chloroflexi bacterium]|nr:hypothetical protein [Chloroflexota bacterium]